MTDQTNDFDLNMHTARLLLQEPFFAGISRRIVKRASHGIPTAGVMVNEETAQFEMLYNPKFFSDLTDKEKLAVLKHEFYHIIFNHITDRAPWNSDDSDTNSRIWNVATDLAINSHIDNLPEKGCIPEQGMFKDFPKGMSAEWYVPKVKELMENQNKDGSSDSNSKGNGEQGDDGESGSQSSSDPSMMDSFDDHSGWGSCSKEALDIAKERLKDIVKEATKDVAAAHGDWGTVSQDMREEIMNRMKTKLDWRKVLRFFIKSSQKANKTNTIRKINRRYPYIHAGRKSNRVANIAVSIDQSGSVDDSMLELFFAELNKLSEIASFTVVPFDTRVAEDKVYVWKKGQSHKTERVLAGGTCFDAPTKYVNDGNFDGHIVLTDMCAPKPKPSKCQRMWMTTQFHYDRDYFSTSERVIVVD